jgi:predicted nucleic acid-binding protein
MTLERLVILNPSTVTLSPSHPVILSNAKDLVLLRVNSAKSLRTSSVKASAVSSAERISGKMTHYHDASYLALALALNAKVITADRKLANRAAALRIVQRV